MLCPTNILKFLLRPGQFSTEEWKSTGRREIIEDAREKVDQILSSHQPLPLDEDVDRELEHIKKKAKESHSH
jgi:trimethylamine:corrinoid methyltransferase-like protein